MQVWSMQVWEDYVIISPAGMATGILDLQCTPDSTTSETASYLIGQFCVQEWISYVSAVYVGVGRLCYHQSGKNGHWYHRGLM